MATFNPQQLKAVTTNNKSVLVLAGAGCGKTKVLVSRIAKHLEDGCAPDQIMAVTFTNKAANEIKERLSNETDINLSGLCMGTFHSIAFKMLKKYAYVLNLKNDFGLLDPAEQYGIICGIIKKLKLEQTKPNVAIKFIADQKEKEIESNKNQLPLERIYFEYTKICKQKNVLDFSDLMLFSYQLLCLPKYQEIFENQFEFVLVDEFQDTSELQYKWLKQITLNKQNLFIVGDDDQSIYGWRNARIDNIWDYQNEYKHEIIRLEQNYRSTKSIIEAANNVISNNTKRLGKELWTENEVGNDVIYKMYPNPDIEIEKIVNEIQQLLNDGIKSKEIAILARTNKQLSLFEPIFFNKKINYYLKGTYNFFKRVEIKLLTSYLNVINGNENDLMYCIDVPARGIGPVSKQKIINYANEHKCTLLESCKNQKNKHVVAFYNEIEEFKKITDVTLLVEAIIAKYDLYNYFDKPKKSNEIDLELEESLLTEKNERINNINEFLKMTKTPNDLDEFLVELVLSRSEFDNKDGVQLSTIHGAKGLEYEYVYIIGCETSILPSWGAKTKNELEEERRMMYVAVTRAKQQLKISFCDRREMFGKMQKANPSIFIQECRGNEMEYL